MYGLSKPGHGDTRHLATISVLSSQSFPPFEAFCTTFRFKVLTEESPHVVLHGPFSQGPNLQSTKIFERIFCLTASHEYLFIGYKLVGWTKHYKVYLGMGAICI